VIVPTLLFLGACVDYRLRERDHTVRQPDDTDVESPLCASISGARAHAVEPLPECLAGANEITDPWALIVEWQVQRGVGTWATPAVGALADTTVDGSVDSRDMPAVVAGVDRPLLAMAGNSGEILFEIVDGAAAGVAIADMDGDTRPDVVTVAGNPQVYSISGTGEVQWVSPELDPGSSNGRLTVADLDADGRVECVADSAVVDGWTGGITALADEPSGVYRSPVLADLDGDGFVEIILGDGVYDRRGDVVWRGPIDERSVFSAVVNADSDLEAEVIFVGGTSYALVDTNGAVLATATLPGSPTLGGLDPGPPCVADMDGDGDPEVGVPADSALSVLELDGSVLWSVPIQDPSGLAGCSAADLDLDGAAEVIFGDEHDLRIYSGRTGEVHATISEHRSGTLFEYPIVADVDLDGAAEIVVVSNTGGDAEGWSGVTVLGHRDGGWPRASPSWQVHDYAPGRMNPDGTVRTPAGRPWLEHNMFRAAPTWARTDAPELRVAITDVCVTSCDDGEVVVAWQVGNHGGASSAPDVVELFALVADGTERVLATAEVGSLAPGEIPEGSSFTVDAAAAAGARLGLTLRDGTGCYTHPHRFIGEVVCP
jgi:hypothetical protein